MTTTYIDETYREPVSVITPDIWLNAGELRTALEDQPDDRFIKLMLWSGEDSHYRGSVTAPLQRAHRLAATNDDVLVLNGREPSPYAHRIPLKLRRLMAVKSG